MMSWDNLETMMSITQVSLQQIRLKNTNNYKTSKQLHAYYYVNVYCRLAVHI